MLRRRAGRRGHARRAEDDEFLLLGLPHHQAAAARQRLLVRETAAAELVISSPEGIELARHRLLAGVGQRCIVPSHYHGLTATAPARPCPTWARRADRWPTTAPRRGGDAGAAPAASGPP